MWLLKEKPQLAVPDCIVTAVGTKIWYAPEGLRAFRDPTEVEWIEDTVWSRRLDSARRARTSVVQPTQGSFWAVSLAPFFDNITHYHITACPPPRPRRSLPPPPPWPQIRPDRKSVV